MQRYSSSDDNAALDDRTVAIPLRSKRTGRMQRKEATRQRRREAAAGLDQLPAELILEVLKLSRPSDVFSFSHVDRRFHELVRRNANIIGAAMIQQRYGILAKCFPLPKMLAEVDPAIQPLLTDPRRQQLLDIHKKPYQHVHPPNPHLTCTCVTCMLTWNNLGLVLDFAHWQPYLDHGEPIPTLPRGETTQWNTDLVTRNARIVRMALANPLWHARILETHLESTIRSIRRHRNNKGNRRTHVDMLDDEAATGTDDFLAKHGPLGIEFPYHRDEYYMLEAYLPNRWWRSHERNWVYIIEGYHERDLALIMHLANR
ncbi:hypothetical protein P154DRAFT_444198 [Amniculicola lignicola CBS 123094]|uniref:F-box domain-containing protein n=1 Tax=Amniculicola lignicola CBS 123094 TaxID=1392246 RepID=A0A6A5W2L5_9PLEO|nr:hypothetical protein P154DRAFT_444198 [Amniculicola lignicola CBS 123094]